MSSSSSSCFVIIPGCALIRMRIQVVLALSILLVGMDLSYDTTTAHRRLAVLGASSSHDKGQKRKGPSTTTTTTTAAAAIGARRPPPLILVMGLPRSGSLSIHEYFVCNHLLSAHYCCGGIGTTNKTHFFCGVHVPTCGQCVHENMLHQRPPFQQCSSSGNSGISTGSSSSLEYQVYSQFDVESGDPFAWFLPQHFALPLLHEAYPDAIWILNTRKTPEQWAISVQHWYSVTTRMLNSFGMSYYSDQSSARIQQAPEDPLSGPKLMQELQQSYARATSVPEHERRKQNLIRIYEKHTEKVRRFVQHYPSHALIQLNVDDPLAGQVLTQALTELVTASSSLSSSASSRHHPGLSHLSADCWKFNAKELDEDWQDFTLKV